MKVKTHTTTFLYYLRITICAVFMTIIFILSGKCVLASDTLVTNAQSYAIDGVVEKTQQSEIDKPKATDIKSQLSDIYESDNQIIIVSQTSTGHGTLYFYIKPENEWKPAIIAPVYTGRNGLDKIKEGDGRTPTGIFKVTKAFGIAKDPGCIMPYTRVDSSYWWVSDPKSDKYNQFVSTKDTPCTWDISKGEHLIKTGKPYNYVLSLDYNSQCIPNAGSAIFIHCEYGKPTSGCIALPKDTIKLLIQNVKQDCPVYIDYAETIVFPS